MAEAALKLIETSEVETKALTIVDQAKAVNVIDSESYIEAGILYKSIGDMMKEVSDTFDGIIKKAHEAHKEALAKKAKFYDPLAAAYKAVKKLMSDYDTEQERKRQEEQRRLAEIARKQAEEQALLDAIAAEEAARAAGATKEEAAQEAAAIIEEPVYVPPVVIQKEVPKVQGVSFREIWKVRIVNESLLPRDVLMPDLIKLGALARALKGQFNVPGAESYSERV